MNTATETINNLPQDVRGLSIFGRVAADAQRFKKYEKLLNAIEGGATLREVVDAYVYTVLVACDGNRMRAARKLGIDRRTLHRTYLKGKGWNIPANHPHNRGNGR